MLSLVAASVLGATAPDATDARLDWFRKARIGMFIHWGPVSLKGSEIGWSRGAEVPTEEYDQLYKSFNPTKFDANAWMRIAKEAGMKYVVPTARHHDGFCLWPSKASEYTIQQTPFKRDIMGEIAGAAKKNGIAMCSYYSILDWKDPRYGTGSPGGSTTKRDPDMTSFMYYVQRQCDEIVTNYGAKMLWFDGQWEAPYTAQMAADLESHLRKTYPKLVINNRVGKKQSDGDYDTPEQKIGSFQRGRAWETCMTICNQWAFKPNDNLKSFDQIIGIVVETVTGDGNLLLNVGPTPEGEIEARQVDRLKELGAWLKKYGESIYGTRGGPWVNGSWGGATCKGKNVYIHLLNWDGTERTLPPLPAKVQKISVLTGNTVMVRAGAEGITMSGAAKNPVDTIVKLQLDKDAFSLGVIR